MHLDDTHGFSAVVDDLSDFHLLVLFLWSLFITQIDDWTGLNEINIVIAILFSHCKTTLVIYSLDNLDSFEILVTNS